MVEPRFFKRDLKRVIQDDDLPDYRISMNFDPADRKRAEEAGQDGRRYSNNRRIIVTILPRGQVGTDYSELWAEDTDDSDTEE